jgi:hypothetical protein
MESYFKNVFGQAQNEKIKTFLKIAGKTTHCAFGEHNGLFGGKLSEK